MHLHSLKIQNFRALEDIYAEFDGYVNVIVGPNAAGKTTVLEAIRFAKAMLAPRVQNETIQVLHSLGAASPHMPNQLRVSSIARDVNKQVLIGCRYKLTDNEFERLVLEKEAIASAVVQARMGQSFAAPGAFMAFLASPQGKQVLDDAKQEIDSSLKRVQVSKLCYLELSLLPGVGPSATGDPIEMQFIAFLERQLPFHKSLFTYFPADRALPAGEQPVQLGGPDAMQQMESYNSQPQLKFQRLKNTIFSASVLGQDEGGENGLRKQFENIFNGILKGRKLKEFGINEIGFLSVLIEDTETGRVFDLDGMSSGEKGLILTFLNIANSVAQDGIVLFDEPELHLNPAVCKDLLDYLVDQYARPRNLQILMCSHSPEILAGALDNDHCDLYHLISPTVLSKIRAQDEITLSSALKRLGVSESENLLYRGIIFVEGPDDVNLLEAGFGSLLRRYKLKFSSGRMEVEKAIRALQDAELQGATPTPTYFIFDRDELPTSLASTASVRVLQWDRRCLENYLIDLDALSNALMDPEVVRNPFTNQGDVSRLLRDLAFQQLEEVAAKNVYNGYAFEGLGIRKVDLVNRSSEEISKALLNRIVAQKKQLSDIDEARWGAEFIERVDIERRQLEAVWATNWQIDCDGKRLLEDLTRRIQLRVNLKRFKIRLMKELALSRSGTWTIVEGHLRNLLEKR